MAEGKYGRLFTEQDVRRLLRFAAHRGQEVGVEALGRDAAGILIDVGARLLVEFESAGEVVDEVLGGEELMRLTFPPDEPLLLLRASEKLTTQEALARDVEFCAWRSEHPDRVKTPD